MQKQNKPKIEYYNKKGRFNYEIEDSFEAGLILLGEEIKAIRSGRVNLTTSYVKIIGGEAFWLGGIINVASGDAQRTRKLLLRKEQIKKLVGKTEAGHQLVPLKLYITRGKAKLEVGLGKSKKKYDKRELIKKRQTDRDIDRSIKHLNK